MFRVLAALALCAGSANACDQVAVQLAPVVSYVPAYAVPVVAVAAPFASYQVFSQAQMGYSAQALQYDNSAQLARQNAQLKRQLNKQKAVNRQRAARSRQRSFNLSLNRSRG